jgi:hypothetical protein
MRDLPQLSVAHSMPQFLPARAHKAASVSETHVFSPTSGTEPSTICQPHTFGVPEAPQTCGGAHVPQLATVRALPQLSAAVTLPQFLPCREQNAWFVS